MQKKALAFILIWSVLWVSLSQPLFADSLDDTKRLLDKLFNQDKNESGGQTGDADDATEQKGTETSLRQKVVEDDYAQVLQNWEQENLADAQPFRTVIHPGEFFSGARKAKLTPAQDARGYDEEVFLWDEQTPEIEFTVNVPQDGLYWIQIDYYALPGAISPVERSIQINGEFPYYEARRIVFPRLWKQESEQFQRDELGNDVYSKQAEQPSWQNTYLMDASYLHDEPLRFYLKKGKNNVKLLYGRDSMLIGRITVESPKKVPGYEEYRKQHAGEESEVKGIYTYEAEKPDFKSDSYIQVVASGDVNVTPYRNALITLNTLGADSWKQGGQSVTWTIEVEQPGFYQIAFKYHQYFKANMPVFRKLLIDGEVPFAEVSAYPFHYTPDWKNEILSDAAGNPYQFYLTAGSHTLTLVANPAPYQRVIRMIRSVMEELNDLHLEIKMATGNTQDVYRDWDITEQMPEITEQLNGLAGKLRGEYEYLKQLSGRKPDEARNLLVGAEQLERLAAEPSSIPYRFEQLSQGKGSVTQKLGDVLLTLPQQPIQLDKFFVYAGEQLPKAKAGLWKKALSIAVNFFTSFTMDYTRISPVDDEALQVWVNRPRQHVMLMQQLANQEFTAKTGIKVSLSLMPNEQKLILANASGKSPDVAMGVNEKFPYELALRGALTDFSQFPDVNRVLKQFAPGAMMPFMFDGGIYALPETQNFWVLYYRKDILDALKLKVPDTWDDVIEMLPALQRYGMNFYVPLADANALKSFSMTAPFIYQQGGELFSPDGTRTAIDSEEALKGFKLMTNIFTVYDMPLQVPSFYNHFRDGVLPIGISNFNTYVELTTAAPELAGWWKIAPYPGIKNDQGEVVRWAPGTGQGIVAFRDSGKQAQAWEFIKWWTSAEVQAEFGNMIETLYGPAYRWNSANLQAFSQLPWPKEDLNVILEQWKWLKDIPHVPGDYMLDRELSNAWNKVVFDGENQRKAIEDAVVLARREIVKKLEEFGYMQEGQTLKTLKIPTIEEINKARGETD